MTCEDHTSGDTLTLPLGNYVSGTLGNYVSGNRLNLGKSVSADTALMQVIVTCVGLMDDP